MNWGNECKNEREREKKVYKITWRILRCELIKVKRKQQQKKRKK